MLSPLSCEVLTPTLLILAALMRAFSRTCHVFYEFISTFIIQFYLYYYRAARLALRDQLASWDLNAVISGYNVNKL